MEQEAIDIDPNTSWNSFNNPFRTNRTSRITKQATSKLILVQFLRIDYQQLNNPFIKQSTCVVFRVYALTSTVSKIIITFLRTLMLDSINYIIPFLLFLDHLSEIAQYLWLVKGATQGRKKLHIALAHLSNIGTILLGAAIISAISRKQDITLEVFFHNISLRNRRANTSQIQLIIYTIWAMYSQSIA